MNKGKIQSSESAASSEEVIIEMPQSEQLSMLAASGPIMLADAQVSETSALNLILLLHYFLMEFLCFV